MENGMKIKKAFKEILKENNQKIGWLSMLLIFAMLISQLAIPFMANPIYLLMQSILMPIFGDIGTLLLLLVSFLYIMLVFFENKKFKYFKKKPLIKLAGLFGIVLFVASITLPINGGRFFGYTKLLDIYEASGITSTFVDRYTGGWLKYNALAVNFNGLIIPLVYYFTGGIITFLIPLLISIGLITFSVIYGFAESNAKSVYSKFITVFEIKNPDKTYGEIDSKKGKSNIDLNQSTEEFSIKLGEEIETKSAIDVISEKIKKEVNQNNKKTLLSDKQYGKEKERLELLKQELIQKRADEPSKFNYVNPNLEKEQRKQKILLNLGFISPTLGDIRKETKLTPEETKELLVPSITNDIETDIADEIKAQAGDPTQEIPTLEFYADEIFEKDVQTILDDATSEHVFILGENYEVESTKEIIVEDIENHQAFKKEIVNDNHYENTKEPTEESIINKTLEKTTITQPPPHEEIRINIEEKNKDKGTEKEHPDWGKNFKIPSPFMLSNSTKIDTMNLQMEAQFKQQQLDELFENFNVGAKVHGFKIGPTVTIFEVKIDPGTKITKVTNLEDNIKLNLSVKDVRIQAPIPGTTYIGVEVPNTTRIPVGFKETFLQTKNEKGGLLITLGQDVFGKALIFDLAKAPHVLVAGSTGSGKSVAINTVLISLLLRYLPTEVKLILIDPKMVEFTPFHNIPHLITPVITNARDADNALKSAVHEMENRYKLMAAAGARNIVELNQIQEKKGEKNTPYIVVVIDELADLMMVASKEVEDSIRRITQKARAAGIHMIVATQRPSTDIITGVIKSNIPSRIAFTVASSIDSRTILDSTGAEKLVGLGDMMISLYGQLPYRGQGAYISIEDVQAVTEYVKKQYNPVYSIDIHSQSKELTPGSMVSELDPLYQSAKRIVLQQQKASTLLLQRYLSIGYNKAANLIDALEVNGIIGPANGSKPRKILISEKYEKDFS